MRMLHFIQRKLQISLENFATATNLSINRI